MQVEAIRLQVCGPVRGHRVGADCRLTQLNWVTIKSALTTAQVTPLFAVFERTSRGLGGRLFELVNCAKQLTLRPRTW